MDDGAPHPAETSAGTPTPNSANSGGSSANGAETAPTGTGILRILRVVRGGLRRAGWAAPAPLAADLPPFPVDRAPRLAADVRPRRGEGHPDAGPGAMLALAVVSAAAGRVKVCATADWIESLNLYLAPALESGNRKSAVFRHATAPLLEWEQRRAGTGEGHRAGESQAEDRRGCAGGRRGPRGEGRRPVAPGGAHGGGGGAGEWKRSCPRRPACSPTTAPRRLASLCASRVAGSPPPPRGRLRPDGRALRQRAEPGRLPEGARGGRDPRRPTGATLGVPRRPPPSSWACPRSRTCSRAWGGPGSADGACWPGSCTRSPSLLGRREGRQPPVPDALRDSTRSTFRPSSARGLRRRPGDGADRGRPGDPVRPSPTIWNRASGLTATWAR